MIRLTTPKRYSTLVILGNYITGSTENGNYSMTRQIKFSPFDPFHTKQRSLDVTFRGVLKSCAKILETSTASYQDPETKMTHHFIERCSCIGGVRDVYATHQEGRIEILAEDGEELILTVPETPLFSAARRENIWEYVFQGNPKLINAILYQFIASAPQGYGGADVTIHDDRLVVRQCNSCD